MAEGLLGSTWTGNVPLIQDNHNCKEGKAESVSGIVKSIKTVTRDLEPVAGEYRMYQPKLGTGVLRRIDIADPWEREPKGTGLAGWIVGVESR